MIVPFNRPVPVGEEFAYMEDAVRRGILSGDGEYTKRANAWLERSIGARKALLTTSCTHALEMSALLLDLQPGDEVIMPSFTFVSTANAFVLRGARPVFVDIQRDTLNIDPLAIEAAVTPRTRAIVVVHYAGIGCEMDAIVAIAERHGLAIVEDNAHGLFGTYRGRPLGSFGAFATQSFHETKNIICGEGGALVINDEAYVEPAIILREKGTDRSRFLRGLVDKYSWVSVGSSFLPSELLAAFLVAQMERADHIQGVRRHVWERYHRELAPWVARVGAQQPHVPAHCTPAYHLYFLLLPTSTDRDAFIRYLREHDVYSVFHYVPLHSSTYAVSQGFAGGTLPVTDSASSRLVRLPLYNDMADAEIDRVLEIATAYRPLAAV